MPTYQARFEKYVTGQGDIWDTIALKCYGDERTMHEMQDANYDYRFVDNFPANIELVVPWTVTIENNLKTSVKVPNIKGLLPWR
jgi:hypothetical protein